MLAKNSNPEKESEASKSDDEEDLSTSLAAEIAALKGGNNKPGSERTKAVKQFNKIDSGAKSMFFVKCDHLNATEILKISENMFTCEEEINVRGMSRIFPVVASCKVSDEIDSDLVFDTVRSKFLVRMRNLVIFGRFHNNFRPKNRNLQNCQKTSPKGEPARQF